MSAVITLSWRTMRRVCLRDIPAFVSPALVGVPSTSVNWFDARGTAIARALVALGSALAGGARRTDARERPRRGLELAHRAGATRLEERARAELVSAGGRPRRVSLTGVEALTPSERR